MIKTVIFDMDGLMFDTERLSNEAFYAIADKLGIVVKQEMRGNLGNMDFYMKKVIRHEIIHAFALESGLRESSLETASWAVNEEMVDWFARQGPKIYKAWQEADAL